MMCFHDQPLINTQKRNTVAPTYHHTLRSNTQDIKGTDMISPLVLNMAKLASQKLIPHYTFNCKKEEREEGLLCWSS